MGLALARLLVHRREEPEVEPAAAADDDGSDVLTSDNSEAGEATPASPDAPAASPPDCREDLQPSAPLLPTLPPLPTPSIPTDHPFGVRKGWKFYVVWVVPGQSVDIRGIHTSHRSEGRAAWWCILPFLPNQRYRYSDGTRLTGQCYSLAEAVLSKVRGRSQ